MCSGFGDFSLSSHTTAYAGEQKVDSHQSGLSLIKTADGRENVLQSDTGVTLFLQCRSLGLPLWLLLIFS